MATATAIIIDASDNLIEARNVRNTVTDALITGATVTAQLQDSTDTDLTGFTNPIVLTDVSGKAGTYRGTFPAQDSNTNVGDLVNVILVVDAGAGLFRTKKFVAEVKG